MNPALECIRLPCSPIHQCPTSTRPTKQHLPQRSQRTQSTATAMIFGTTADAAVDVPPVPALLSSVTSVSSVANAFLCRTLDGGRPGTRTPTTVSRLGRLATCCLTIRQAFRPASCFGGGRGSRTPEASRPCPLSRRVPRPAGRPPSYPVAEGEGLEPSDHSRGLLLSGQVPCR